MRNAYIKSLEDLFNQFVNLGGKVQNNLNEVMVAFEKRDVTLAREIIASDQYINEANVNMEKDAIELIALQQPVTKDLRQIITVLKAGTNLERMADHVRSIANLTIELSESQVSDEKLENNILKMGSKASDMLENIIQAFHNSDVEFAKAIAKQDDDIDELNEANINRVTKLVQTENEGAEVFTLYLSISSSIERFGDYITNLAELLVYLETAEMVELNSKYFSKVKS